jgi:hypothetical protein
VPLEEPNSEKMLNTNPRYFIKNYLAEGYFLKYFFHRVDFTPLWTDSDSNLFFKQFFIIVDKEQLDLFWFKYNRYFESINIFNQVDFNFRKRLSFVDWIESRMIH